MNQYKKAILLMGATATGKTELALRLSTKYPIELISVDSALIYTDMNIGTAKPSLQELLAVPHYLIDIITPLDSYSVAQFLNSANYLIRDIISRDKIPVLVGGTMMYYNALLNGISTLPEANLDIRKIIEERILTYGLESIHKELALADSISANKININDKQRIIRALEVYYLTNKPISQLQQETNVNLCADINFLPLAIIPNDRTILHARINNRFDNMLTSGFIDEVANLRNIYPDLTVNHPSMRSVGYYQVWQYLEGQISSELLLEMGKAATRQLAKRQLTWLRSMNIINLAKNSFDIKYMYSELERQICPFIFKHPV